MPRQKESAAGCPEHPATLSGRVDENSPTIRKVKPHYQEPGIMIYHGDCRGPQVQRKVSDYRAGNRCYTYKGVHIPGCWGCVIRGHSACTCRSPKQEDVISRMDMLERRIAELEGRI